jgi:hypothetical protein
MSGFNECLQEVKLSNVGPPALSVSAAPLESLHRQGPRVILDRLCHA